MYGSPLEMRTVAEQMDAGEHNAPLAVAGVTLALVFGLPTCHNTRPCLGGLPPEPGYPLDETSVSLDPI